MDTVRFAVIGTNWITGALIDAGRTVDGFDVVAVCSRSAPTGREFADRYGIARVHTSVADLATDPDVDAVYIASPNSLHAEQSIAMLHAGKHVLTEKPMGANAREVEAMAAAALAADRVLMEAYTSPWEPNVEAIRDALPEVGALRRVVLAKDQYSSRYDKLKAGELPNAFNPAFAAGSLMDLGIYPVALSLLLFGQPDSVHATGTRPAQRSRRPGHDPARLRRVRGGVPALQDRPRWGPVGDHRRGRSDSLRRLQRADARQPGPA